MAEFKITVLRFPQNAARISYPLNVLPEDLPFFGPHPIALVSGAPNEDMVEKHLNIALLNVF